MYYDTHSMYVRREDGMKIFYYPDRTECLYPNGLLITTSLNTHMRIGDMIYGDLPDKITMEMNLLFDFSLLFRDCINTEVGQKNSNVQEKESKDW